MLRSGVWELHLRTLSAVVERRVDDLIFCFVFVLKGGNVLANGTWVNAGGNQAVTWGGLTANSQNGGAPYDDPDGGQSLRYTCYSYT